MTIGRDPGGRTKTRRMTTNASKESVRSVVSVQATAATASSTSTSALCARGTTKNNSNDGCYHRGWATSTPDAFVIKLTATFVLLQSFIVGINAYPSSPPQQDVGDEGSHGGDKFPPVEIVIAVGVLIFCIVLMAYWGAVWIERGADRTMAEEGGRERWGNYEDCKGSKSKHGEECELMFKALEF